jgi:photosynthetic reaction center cytochrome c subunit
MNHPSAVWLARATASSLLIVGSALLGGCYERPPVDTVQTGIRGIGDEQVINPRLDAIKYKKNQIPEPIPPADADGPPATLVFQNLKVLKDLNIGQFTRVMQSMAAWVAPADQSCNYCHEAVMSSDAKYTKRVARRMLQMVRYINKDWRAHVGKTGVTCYTCHRGQPVPEYRWFINPGQSSATGLIAGNAGKNKPSIVAGLSALPGDPFKDYLLGSENIRVQAGQALRGTDYQSIKQTERTYAFMISITQALGVNCSYCHSTRALRAWDQSTPMRATAWYGIRMARDLNNNFMVPLTSTFPEHRLGVLGDAPKIACITCHQGVFKPLYGVSMAKNYPELSGGDHPIGGLPPPTPPGESPAPHEVPPAMFAYPPPATDETPATPAQTPPTAALVAPH